MSKKNYQINVVNAENIKNQDSLESEKEVENKIQPLF